MCCGETRVPLLPWSKCFRESRVLWGDPRASPALVEVLPGHLHMQRAPPGEAGILEGSGGLAAACHTGHTWLPRPHVPSFWVRGQTQTCLRPAPPSSPVLCLSIQALLEQRRGL